MEWPRLSTSGATGDNYQKEIPAPAQVEGKNMKNKGSIYCSFLDIKSDISSWDNSLKSLKPVKFLIARTCQDTRSNLGSLGFLLRKSKGWRVRVPVHSNTVLAAGSNQQIRTEEGKVFNDFQVFLGRNGLKQTQTSRCLDSARPATEFGMNQMYPQKSMVECNRLVCLKIGCINMALCWWLIHANILWSTNIAKWQMAIHIGFSHRKWCFSLAIWLWVKTL